jgi:nitrite reductase/ring-hydroxylating ferredoxin subunit
MAVETDRTEYHVGSVEYLETGKRLIATIEGREVAVFAHNGVVYAYRNTCLHQGGPIGEGIIIGRVEAVLDEQKKLVREEFSDTELQLVCPWHGWAYDLETGVCAGLPDRRLRKYEVAVRDGEVYVHGLAV